MTHISKTMDQLYKTHEKEKMRKYNSRILTVEKGSFTPLVYTTFGGWAPQATRYLGWRVGLLYISNN